LQCPTAGTNFVPCENGKTGAKHDETGVSATDRYGSHSLREGFCASVCGFGARHQSDARHHGPPQHRDHAALSQGPDRGNSPDAALARHPPGFRTGPSTPNAPLRRKRGIRPPDFGGPGRASRTAPAPSGKQPLVAARNVGSQLGAILATTYRLPQMAAPVLPGRVGDSAFCEIM
jgi:hypothetical protein